MHPHSRPWSGTGESLNFYPSVSPFSGFQKDRAQVRLSVLQAHPLANAGDTESELWLG